MICSSHSSVFEASGFLEMWCYVSGWVIAVVLKERSVCKKSGTIHPTTQQHIPEYLKPLINLNREGNQIAGLHLLNDRGLFCLLILCFKSNKLNLIFGHNVIFFYTVI